MLVYLLFACATKTISGTVLSSDGVPLQNAIVTLEREQTVTNTDGQFTMAPLKLKRGDYQIRVTHEGYVFQENEYTIRGAHFTVPPLTLQALDEEAPYLPINLDPNPQKVE